MTLDAAPARRGSGLVVPVVLTVFGLCGLIGLGTWQLERRAWKQELVARLSERLSQPPQPLPPPSTWEDLTAAEMEFRRVRFRAAFLQDKEALVYSAGSALRPDVSGPGYWAFTPARAADGAVLIVNRGFVPADRRDPQARMAGQVAGELDLIGVLRWPEARSWLTPADSPEKNLWFTRDLAGMAKAKGLERVAPFYVELEEPLPPGGLPRAGRLTLNLPNNHLQYAITWYGLAAGLAGVFLVWFRGRRASQPIRG